MKIKLLLGLLALAAAVQAAQVDVGTRAQVTSANPKSTLDRPSDRITSTVEVTLKNTGDRELRAPLHAVIDFTAQSGALNGLLVPGAQGGIGVGLHGAFFYDLTTQVPGGTLAAGASTTFILRFSPPANARVTYAVRLFAELNNDPIAVAGGPYSGRVGQSVSFDSIGTQDPDGDPITFEWNFGDGSALSTMAAPSHAYAQAGRYEAVLTVRDNRGAQKVARAPVLISPAAVYGLARVRSLDGSGQPLGGVDVTETRAGVSRGFATAGGTGFASLGQQPGNYTWQFAKAGFLTVFRSGLLAADEVGIVPSPWLARLNAATQRISPLNDALIKSPKQTVSLSFPAGAFLQPADVALTELNTQSLPLPLPAGWSPLAAFHFATTDEPSQPGQATVTLAALASGGAAVVHFDRIAARWDCIAIGATLPVASSGTYAVVAPDGAPTAPPSAEIGQALAGTTAPVNLEGVTATGAVTPAVAAASREADRVTASARATFTTLAPVPSGVAFPTHISETYELAPSGSARTPDYDTTIFAYRRPAGALTADFPLRPQLLLGSSELQQATVRVDVLDSADFVFGVLDQDGGVVSAGGVTVTVPSNGVSNAQVAELNTLDPQSFASSLGGTAPDRAFDLNLAPLASGKTFTIAFTGLEAGARYVLGIVVSDGVRRGVTPVERFLANASGELVSEEPAAGERLPGAQSGGQYALVKVPAPLGIVSGIARDVSGQPAGGLAVTVDGQPWLVFSKADGSYQILASLGTALVSVVDARDGNAGSATANVTDVTNATNANLSTAPTGPRVASTEPAAGATNANVVTPLVVRFSEPIAPGSFGAAGLSLAKVGGGAVVGSLSLNLANTVATFLPANPLEAATAYTITVAGTILDLQNLPIEGDLSFTFTTAAPTARGAGAQLVIYEPGAANVPADVLSQLVGYAPGDKSKVVATGTAGTADPNVPVILVNETSGETATVLSKADGSFTTFVHASEEDFVTAVFVNANGTRVRVPATRQLFDDGHVGLYRAGGILEAQSDNGPVQVIVAPDAIAGRSKFMLGIVPLAELLTELQNTLPENGRLLGGLRIEVSGDPLAQPADVSFPVDPSSLDVPAGEQPEHGIYAMCEKVEFDGQVQYGIVDHMNYEDGRLVTHSPPFPGVVGAILGPLLYLPVQIGFGSQATVVGRALTAPDSFVPPTNPATFEAMILNGTSPLVPQSGVVVNANLASIDVSGRLHPGAFVARTNRGGFYAMIVPENPFNPEAIVVRGLSLRLPGNVAKAVFTPIALALQVPGQVPVTTANLIFHLPVGAASSDDFAPLLSARTNAAVLPILENAVVTIEARDDQTVPTIQSLAYDPEDSVPLVSGETLLTTDVMVMQASPQIAGTSISEPVTMFVRKAAIIALRVNAADQAGNHREAVFKFRFGAPPPLTGDDPDPSDTNDLEPPRVVAVSPAPDSFVTDGRAVLFFSERVRHTELEAANVVTLDMPADGPVVVRLSPEGTSATVDFSGLKPDMTYTATLTSTAVRDLNSNFMNDAFIWTFRTPAVAAKTLGGLTQAVASVVSGSVIVSIGRDDDGKLVTHAVGDTDSIAPLGTLGLPPFPRALTDIGMFSFKRKPEDAMPVTRRLVAATGGLTGTDEVGPWLWVIDVTDAAHPTRVASSLVTADFASIAASLRWDPPYLMLAISTFERNFIDHVNLQAFILGSEGNHMPEYHRGVDLNDDGDFVDVGETLPIPEAGTLFGLEIPLPLAPHRQIIDFDSAIGGRFLIAALASNGSPGDKSRLAVLSFQGLSITDGDGPEGVVEFSNPGINRVLLDLDFPIHDATGTRHVPVAVTTADDTVKFWDLTNPNAPVALMKPDNTAVTFNLHDLVPSLTSTTRKIFSLRRTGDDEYTIATGGGLFAFSRSRLGDVTRQVQLAEPHADAPFGGGRTIGGSALAFSTGTGVINVINRPPHVSVVRFPGHVPKDIDGLIADGEMKLRDLLDDAIDQPFLQPVIFPDTSGAPAQGTPPIDPPDALVHQYVRVQASGALGATLRIAAESLDLSGNLNTPLGADNPPVILTDKASDLSFTGDVHPVVTAILLKRLSSDPANVLYNEYLSSPFLIVRQKLTTAQKAALTMMPGRVALWSGVFLRFGFDAITSNDADLTPWLAKIMNSRFSPGIARTYLGLPSEYIDSPNPSRALLAPRIAGVDLQSGEFSAPEADYHIEGRHQDILLQRVYQSRSQYIGPFGRGWDHNYNARIVLVPNTLEPGTQLPLVNKGDAMVSATAGDALLIDGAGTVMLFREISAAKNNLVRKPLYATDPALAEFYGLNAATETVATFYDSPAGVFSILVRLKDGRFVHIAPTGHRMVFYPDGRLDRLIGAFKKSELVMSYRDDGLLDKVVGDRDLELRFGYYFPALSLRRVSTTDRVSQDPLKLARVARVECSDTIAYKLAVDYDYDTKGRLWKVTPNLGKETVLTWDQNNPDLLVRLGSGDGTKSPAVQVTYDNNGIATGVDMGGSGFTFGGAKGTAKERFETPGNVTVTPTNGVGATIPLDRRGSPTSFAGRTLAADDATGAPMRFDSPEQRVEMEYDTMNTVYRFRGNVTKTKRGETGKQVIATTTYDGQAFNRPMITTAGDGVVTNRQYIDLGIAGLDVTETTGPVAKHTTYNNFGQLESEEQKSNGMLDFSTTYTLGSQPADAHLISTTAFDTSSTTNRDGFGRAESFGKDGGLRFTLNYVSGTGELHQQLPSLLVVPTTTYSYDTQLRLATETVDGGASGIVSTYSYADARYPGRVTNLMETETGLPPSTTSYVYNASAQIDTVTIDNETTTYTYNGALTTGVHGPGESRDVAYNGPSYRLQSITENGIETDFTYDGSDRLSTITSQGATTTFSYDSAPTGSDISERIIGKKIMDTASNTMLLDETWHHDAAGRLDHVTSNLSGRTRDFTYFADGGLHTTKINGQTVRDVTRDTSGHLMTTRLNQLNIAFSNYDAATGQPQHEILTFSGSTGGTVTINKTFDAVGRVLTEDPPTGHYAFRWDRFGNLNTHTDPDSVVFSQTAAPSGLPLNVTFTDGTGAQHFYDAHRRRSSILTAVGSIGFIYDGDGFVKQITYPDGLISKFEQRNAFFEAEKVTHGDHIQTHSYDAAGRLMEIDEQNTGDSWMVGYDALGRRTSTTFNDVSTEFGYTPGGAANSETTKLAGTSLGTWSQTLDGLDHVMSETYPTGGFMLTYQPDTFGQPQNVSQAGINSVTWRAASLPDEIRYAGGLTVRHDYDAGLRLTGVRYIGPTTSGFRYSLTGGGRVEHEERLHPGGFDVFTRNGPGEGMRITGFAFGASNKFGTDAVASLSGVGFANGEITSPSQQSNPTLTGADPRGFFPSIVRPNGTQRPSSIAGTAITYDASGSMTAFPVWVVLPGQTGYTQINAIATYDGLGQIATISRADGVTVTYTRDGLARVFEREITGPPSLCRPGKTRYRWKSDRLIEELEQPAGAVSFALARRYVWLDERLALVQSAPSPGAALVDFVPLVTINGGVGGFLTTAGALVEVINYTAYGAPFVRAADGLTPVGRSAIGPTVLFQGAWYDDASGLYQFGKRTLHPFSGLFLERDSALFSDSLGFFTAFNGDPAGRVDPTGTLSDQAKDTIAFLKQNKELYNAAKEIREPAAGLVKAIGDGDLLEIAGGAAETINKTIGLCTSTSDEDVKERYKLLTDSLDHIKEGVDVLKAVNGLRKDRELLRAISVFTGAGGSTANVSLRNLARLGAGASPSDVRDSILDLSGSIDVHNTAIKVRGNPSAAAKFYHEQRAEASKRRRENLKSISKGVHSLGKVLVSQYLANDEAASRTANQFIATSEAGFELANAITDVLESKKLSRFRFQLNPLQPKRALGSIKRFANLAEGRSAVQAAFTAGFEVGKFAIIALSDDDVAKAYVEQVKQFEDNGGYLTVAGGVLSTFGFDDAALRVQEVQDIRDAFSKDLDFGLQKVFDGVKRAADRREAYLNGISEP